MHTSLLVLLFLLYLFGTFFFAGSETGFVSWNPLKVSHRAGQGDSVARWALYLMNHKDRVIAAILIGSNVCMIGATLSFLSLFEQFAHSISLNISDIPSAESWILTPVMVLFCEMLPKSLFRTYSFRLTMRSIPVLFVTFLLTFPFTWAITEFTRLFKRNSHQNSPQSFMTKVREEMILIAGEGSRRGTLIDSADRYINSILNLKDRNVSDLMVSINDFHKRYQFLDASITVGDLRKTRILNDEVIIIDGKTGCPTGIVNLLDIIGADDQVLIQKFVKPLEHVSQSTPIFSIFQFAIKSSLRFINVIDEKREIVGVIDKVDLFKTVFGGIQTSFVQE